MVDYSSKAYNYLNIVTPNMQTKWEGLVKDLVETYSNLNCAANKRDELITTYLIWRKGERFIPNGNCDMWQRKHVTVDVRFSLRIWKLLTQLQHKIKADVYQCCSLFLQNSATQKWIYLINIFKYFFLCHLFSKLYLHPENCHLTEST